MSPAGSAAYGHPYYCFELVVYRVDGITAFFSGADEITDFNRPADLTDPIDHRSKTVVRMPIRS